MWDNDNDEEDDVSAAGLARGVAKEDVMGIAASWHVDSPPISMSEPVANSLGGSTGGRLESKENIEMELCLPIASILMAVQRLA